LSNDDFLGFLFFEITECPHCKQAVTKDKVEENLDQDIFTWPYCNKESDAKELV
jgi:hypothetical protein